MKIVLMGNAGAGKTTLSRALMAGAYLPRLSLDEVAFSAGVERRPLAESISDVLEFIGSHENWIIEGCYADIIEPILEHCETLVFLNPGWQLVLSTAEVAHGSRKSSPPRQSKSRIWRI